MIKVYQRCWCTYTQPKGKWPCILKVTFYLSWKLIRYSFGEICKHQDRHELHYLKHFPPKLPQNSNFHREVDWCIRNINIITLGTRQKPEKNMTLLWEREERVWSKSTHHLWFWRENEDRCDCYCYQKLYDCCQWWVFKYLVCHHGVLKILCRCHEYANYMEEL